MKRAVLLSLILIGRCVVFSAQAPPSQKDRIFTALDGTFRFSYSRAMVSCQRNSNQSNRWEPDDSCNAYIPVCSDFSGDSAATLACIAYPASGTKGTNLEAAAFSVNEL